MLYSQITPNTYFPHLLLEIMSGSPPNIQPSAETYVMKRTDVVWKGAILVIATESAMRIDSFAGVNPDFRAIQSQGTIFLELTPHH